MKFYGIRFLLCLALLLCATAGQAQSSLEIFGKNRIQYKTLKWQQFTAESFEIHFYEGGEEIAKRAAVSAEENLERIGELFGYIPSKRIRLFVYNSSSDLLQSNVGLDDRDFLRAGQTDFVKLQIEVPFTGSMTSFDQTLRKKLAEIIIDDMMYGGNFGDQFTGSLLLDLPEWFTKGITAYAAYGWDGESDGFVRDLLAVGKLKKLSSYSDKEAELIGQSVWNFIAEGFGPSYIYNILNQTRITRKTELGFANSVGTSFNYIIAKWKEYYLNDAYRIIGNYEAPEQGNQVIKKSNRKSQLGRTALSADGNYAGYSVYHGGRFKVILQEIASGKKRTVFQKGFRINVGPFVKEYPLIRSKNGDTFGIIYSKKGVPALREVGFKSTTKFIQKFDGFKQITGFDYAPDGQQIVFSGVRNAQSDIWTADLKTGRLQQITNDSYDDLYPSFTTDGKSIVFSSYHPANDESSEVPQLVGRRFQVYKTAVTGTNNPVEPITDNDADNTFPQVVGDDIFFISDQSGIYNLYKFDTKSKQTHAATAFQQDIQHYDVSSNGTRLLFTGFSQGKKLILFDPNFNYETKKELVKTLRKQTLQGYHSVGKEDPESDIRESVDINKIDTDDYVFESEKGTPGLGGEENPIYTALRPRSAIRTTRTEPFKTKMGADNTVFNFTLDPLRGFGFTAEAGASDILGNHRFNGGGLLILDNFRNSNFFGAYRYLGLRPDFSLRYDRGSIFLEGFVNDNFFVSQRNNLNRIEAAVSYPLSPNHRFSAAPVYTNTTHVNRSVVDLPDVSNHYAGFKAEYVYDNTLPIDINILKGMRAKVKYESLFHTSDKSLNFSMLDVDVRKYVNILKKLTFAVRLSYGKFFGASKKKYLLGGMDNWAFAETDFSGLDNPLVFYNEIPAFENKSDLLFHKYVTNLRGFDYNVLFGTEHLLLNAELRFPVVRYLYNGPITSNFLKDLQLTAFTDVGSAWTNSAIFNPFVTVIDGEEFDAKIDNYSPFIGGVGGGIRTSLFGYYMKFDVAWGIRNYELLSPKFYLTFGYDF